MVRRRRIQRVRNRRQPRHARASASGETLGAWLATERRFSLVAGTSPGIRAYEQATLYDEHTWGAFASIDAPTSLWTRSQWNRKSNFAYTASAEALDMMARASRDPRGKRGRPRHRGNVQPGRSRPARCLSRIGADSVLVLNTLPWARTVTVEEPELRGWAAPAGVLESFFPRDVPWGGVPPGDTELRRVTGEVPGFGYAFLPLDDPARSR